MTIPEFIQAVKDGKVKFNWNGHNASHDRALTYKPEEVAQYGTTIRARDIERFVSDLERKYKFRVEYADNYKPKNDLSQEDSDGLIKYYKEKSIRLQTEPIAFSDWVWGEIGSMEYCCFGCGEGHLFFVPTSESTVEIMSLDLKKSNRDIDLPLKEKQECIFKDGVPATEVEIDVPTGKLVFVNFFTNKDEFDKPDVPYFEGMNINEDSINYAIGRINTTKWYAEKHNIGYGQMGNMSLGIWQGRAKSKKGSIVIGDKYDPCQDDTGNKGNAEDKAYHALKKTHQMMGSITCDMWRWMCIDASLIDMKYCHPYDTEPIILNVPPGRYKIRHLFRSDTEHNETIYSTLEKM